MKKVFTALFIGLLVSSYAFTQEFIISPAIGYAGMGFIGDVKTEVTTVSNTTPPVKLSVSDTVSAVSSMNLMEIGVTSGRISKNGFTFMFSTFVAPTTGSGKATVKSPKVSKELVFTRDIKKGLELGVSAIFGYTFKSLDNKLYFNIGSGLAGRFMLPDSYYGGAKFNNHAAEEACLGIPIQAGVQYFFTDSFGINVLVADELGVGIFNMGENKVKTLPVTITTTFDGLGFSNVFSVKVGPVFKIGAKKR